MHYALLIYGALDARRARAEADTADDGVIESWLGYTRALREAGVLAGAEQLNEAETATSVRVRTGERLLTDGPFVETKEHLLGFYLVDVPNLDAAIEWAARMPAVRYGTIEVRPVVRTGDWRNELE